MQIRIQLERISSVMRKQIHKAAGGREPRTWADTSARKSRKRSVAPHLCSRGLPQGEIVRSPALILRRNVIWESQICVVCTQPQWSRLHDITLDALMKGVLRRLCLGHTCASANATLLMVVVERLVTSH